MMSRDEVVSAAWRGMIWRFLERCSSQVVSFVVSVILARLLLPEEYGIIAMTMIFIALSEVFVTSGLGSALIQKSSYDEESFSTMFWVSVVFALLLYGMLFLLAPYIAFLMHTPELVPVLRVLGLRLPISAMNSIQQAYVSQQMIFKKFFFLDAVWHDIIWCCWPSDGLFWLWCMGPGRPEHCHGYREHRSTPFSDPLAADALLQ